VADRLALLEAARLERTSPRIQAPSGAVDDFDLIARTAAQQRQQREQRDEEWD
jgi:hypothetical protein